MVLSTPLYSGLVRSPAQNLNNNVECLFIQSHFWAISGSGSISSSQSNRFLHNPGFVVFKRTQEQGEKASRAQLCESEGTTRPCVLSSATNKQPRGIHIANMAFILISPNPRAPARAPFALPRSVSSLSDHAAKVGKYLLSWHWVSECKSPVLLLFLSC